MTGFIIASIITAALVFGIFSGILAKKKGYTGHFFWLGLILNIIGLIYVAGLPVKTAAAQALKQPAAEPPKPAPKAVAPAAVRQPEKTLPDTELVAVITAAIAAFLGTSESGLIVRSYRRVRSGRPSWNRAGRYEQLDRF